MSVYRTIGPLVLFAITAAGVVPCGGPKMILINCDTVLSLR